MGVRNYGRFLIEGHAGFLSSDVGGRLQVGCFVGRGGRSRLPSHENPCILYLA